MSGAFHHARAVLLCELSSNRVPLYDYERHYALCSKYRWLSDRTPEYLVNIKNKIGGFIKSLFIDDFDGIGDKDFERNVFLINAKHYVREKHYEIETMVNKAFDDIVAKLTLLSNEELETQVDYEALSPITQTWAFHKKKPTAVLFGKERINVDNWQELVQTIFKKVFSNAEMKNRTLDLQNKSTKIGRQLSADPDNMKAPLKLDEKLYIEADKDAPELMRFIITILKAICYDYKSIRIAVKL